VQRQIAGSRDEWANLKVQCSSIDAFQGRECDVLIYSVTRSNRHGQLGFLREERRLNVALSRGRFGLVLVGDHVFARAAGDSGNPFRRVVDYIERHPDSCSITEVDV
jgi:superfamily I DNA and/or RNA helicase